MPLTIALAAGEASGDSQGARLAVALRDQDPSVELVGIGGPNMARSGVELLADSSHWGAIGVAQSLTLIPPLLAARRRLESLLRRRRPDLLLPIDFGAFNVRLAHPLRQHGIRVLYYFPPRSWDPRATISPHLRDSVDAVASPFPWSAQRFREAGVPAAFVGHPLLEIDTVARASLCQELGLEVDRAIVALLPGSRRHEVSYLWPRMLQAALRIAERVRGVQYLVPAAPSVDRQALLHARDRLRKGLSLRVLDGRVSDVLAASDAALVCSGTATLEAAIQRTPMVICYGGGLLMNLEWRMRKRRLALRAIGLPNLIAGRKVVTELIEEATPDRMAAEIVALLTDPVVRTAMQRDLEAIRAPLGSTGATRRTAAIALELAKGGDPAAVCAAHSLETESIPCLP